MPEKPKQIKTVEEALDFIAAQIKDAPDLEGVDHGGLVSFWEHARNRDLSNGVEDTRFKDMELFTFLNTMNTLSCHNGKSQVIPHNMPRIVVEEYD